MARGAGSAPTDGDGNPEQLTRLWNAQEKRVSKPLSVDRRPVARPGIYVMWNVDVPRVRRNTATNPTSGPGESHLRADTPNCGVLRSCAGTSSWFHAYVAGPGEVKMRRAGSGLVCSLKRRACAPLTWLTPLARRGRGRSPSAQGEPPHERTNPRCVIPDKRAPDQVEGKLHERDPGSRHARFFQ